MQRLNQVNLVRIINGKYSTGRDSYREVVDVLFPLVDGTIHKHDRGSYIIVDGVPVRGYPKRNFKVYVSNRSCFKILTEAEARGVDLEQQVGAGRSLSIPAVADDAKSEDGELILHGPDDDAIKERINERFYYLKRAVWAAADSELTGIVVSGPPGVGKSFEVEEALKRGENDMADVMAALTKSTSDAIDPDTPAVKMEKKPDIRYKVVGGHMSPLEVYKTLYDYRDSRSVVVFDDCDIVLYNEQSLNLLKRALDTGAKERVIDWGSSALDGSGYDKRFTFHGAVIFISNIDFERPPGRSSALAEHLAAIMDRSYYIDLTMKTLRDKFLRIEQVCKDFGVLQESGLEPPQVDEVMAYFEANLSKFRSISIRTVQKIATQYRTNPTDWQRSAMIYTFKTEEQ